MQKSEDLSASEIDLVHAWIALQYASSKSTKYEESFWAYMKLDDLIDENAEKALRIIYQIQIEDESEFLTANLAAGPLESLLTRHGPDVIESIEKISHKSNSFRIALGMVWKSDIRDDVWLKIKRLTG